MKRVIIALVLALLAAGCSEPTTVCRGPAQEISVCVNGQRIPFEAQRAPHRHEAGSLYVPVEPVAHRLGLDVRSVISGDGQSAIVTVNGKPFDPAMAHGARGIHVHDGQVFVPLRELAASAGLDLDMDAELGIAGFAR